MTQPGWVGDLGSVTWETITPEKCQVLPRLSNHLSDLYKALHNLIGYPTKFICMRDFIGCILFFQIR